MLKHLKSYFKTIDVNPNGISFKKDEGIESTKWLDVASINVIDLMFIDYLHITCENNTTINGFYKSSDFEQDFNALAINAAATLTKEIRSELELAYPTNRYLDSLLRKFTFKISTIKRLLKLSKIKTTSSKTTEIYGFSEVTKLLENIGDTRNLYIEEHVELELIKYEEFFDTVEKTPLTEEQRRACVVCDDRQLLIAAAGSGKSSTLVAKIGYLIEKEWVEPNEIVALAFNAAAAKEIKERAEKRLSHKLDGSQIRAQTFHKFGLELIGKLSKRKPSQPAWLKDDKIRLRNIHAIVMDLISTDEVYAKGWNILTQICKAKGIKPKVNSGKKGKFRTLQGEYVASREEVNICDFLFVHGIEYEYERPYEIECSDLEHRQYTPDFYYPSIGVYHEHFALDRNGNAPNEFEGYLEKTEWRRNTHRENKTKFFETLSADFPNTIYEKILYNLREFGYDFDNLDFKNIALGTIELDDPVINEIDKFVSNRRSSVNPIEYMLDRAKLESPHLKDAVLLGEAVKNRIETTLNTENLIDYAGMIKLPTELLRENPTDLGFKIILIDEFQDLSPDRAELIKAILDACPGCKLFGVGDDWQAINGYSGSELRLMINFNEIFGAGTTQYLTKTFRSNQGICDVSRRFVTMNPEQLKKTVDAIDKNTKNVIELHFFNDSSEYLQWTDWITLAFDEDESVFVLVRYNKQKLRQNGDRLENVWGAINESLTSDMLGSRLTCLTSHSSKGLEADSVIILGMLDEDQYRSGFPATRENSGFIQLSTPHKETYLSAEERRLFYVALTRAKKRVIIPVPLQGASPFIDELITQSPENLLIYVSCSQSGICPKCKKGVKVIANGKYGEFYRCSKKNECNWTQSIPARNLKLDQLKETIISKNENDNEPEWLNRLACSTKQWVKHCFIPQFSSIPTFLRIDPKYGDWDIAATSERHPQGVLLFKMPLNFSHRYLIESYELFSNWAKKSSQTRDNNELQILEKSIREYFAMLEESKTKLGKNTPIGLYIDTKDELRSYLNEFPIHSIERTIRLLYNSNEPLDFLNNLSELHPSKTGWHISYSHEVRINICDWLSDFGLLNRNEYNYLNEMNTLSINKFLHEMVAGINEKQHIISSWNDAFRLPGDSDEYLDPNMTWAEFYAKSRDWQLTAIRAVASVTYRMSLCCVSVFIDAPDDLDIAQAAQSEKLAHEWKYLPSKEMNENNNCIQKNLGALAWRLARMQGLI